VQKIKKILSKKDLEIFRSVPTTEKMYENLNDESEIRDQRSS
jgi:hypothetical protein